MAHNHLKGEKVNLLIKGSDNSYAVVAASDSCDLSLTANTSDAAAKDDPGNGEWDNPQFQNYSWSCSNQSFVVNISTLQAFITKMVSGDASVDIKFQVGGSDDSRLAVGGTAVVTSLDIDAPNGDFVKMTVSLEGNGALSTLQSSDIETIVAASSLLARIKGKALMVASKASSGVYRTVACATGHKLTISCQTSDASDKDMNDNFNAKEVTGRSISLTTDNLLPSAPGTDALGLKFLYDAITAGTELTLAFGYYPNSIGKDTIDPNTGVPTHNWGEPGTGGSVLVEGKFLISSLSVNGQAKNDATYSAEFQGKGAPSVSA